MNVKIKLITSSEILGEKWTILLIRLVLKIVKSIYIKEASININLKIKNVSL